MSYKDKGIYSIKAVENALDFLEAFGDLEGDLSITDLCNRLGVQKSYAFRMLATLETRGYVEQVKTNGKYRTGLSAYETGRKLLCRMDLLRRTKTIMETLAHDCNESIYLALPGKKDVLFVDLVESRQQVQVMPLVGNRYLFENCSAGLLIKAFKTDPKCLTTQLRKIRYQESCLDQGVLDEGVASLSVPIFSRQGQIAACFCLVAPDFRLNKKAAEQILLPLMKGASQSASMKLGYFQQSVGNGDVRYASL